jgi:hypothetical protein
MEYKMKKVSLFMLICMLVCISRIAQAQEPKLPPFPDGQSLSLSIWNSNIEFANEGMFACSFTIDGTSLFTLPIMEISDLVIETNFGNIESSDVLSGTSAGRYGSGMLYFAEVDQAVIINKATATVDGKRYDITENITIEQFKPLTIAFKNNFSGDFTDSFIIIWHIDTDYVIDDEVKQVYSFMINLEYFNKNNFNILENLIIETNEGSIVFSEQKIAKPNIKNKLIGSLTTASMIGELNIIKVTTQIDGTNYDITHLFSIKDFIPIQVLNLSSPDKNNCPTKILDYAVYEGNFKSIYGDDRIVAVIQINNDEKEFDYHSSLVYFFNDERNLGRKVKIVVEKKQLHQTEYHGEVIAYSCNTAFEEIVNVLPIP